MSKKNRERQQPPSLLDRSASEAPAPSAPAAAVSAPAAIGHFVRHRYDANGELMNSDAG